MNSPSPSSAGPAPLRFVSSLGMKMLLVACGLLILSFSLGSLAMMVLTRRMLQANLESMVSRDSRFLGAISDGLFTNPGAQSKQQLTQLATSLLKEPEILSITFLDAHRHIVAQAAKAIQPSYVPFSLQLPVFSNRRPVGWIRAWYSPGLAIEEFWRLASDLVIVLLCGTLVIFVLVFLVLNEWILARPFQRLLTAIDATENTGGLLTIDVPSRSDEWGLLAARLNQFLGHVIDLQEQSKVLYETSRLLGVPWELKGALEGILSGLLHRYNLSSCVVFGPGGNHELRARFASGISEELTEKLTIRSGQGTGGVAFASATRRLIADVNETVDGDPVIREMIQRQQVRSVLFVPMEGEGHTWGVTAYFSRIPNNFPGASVDSLSAFTSQLTLAVRNAQLMSQLKDFNQGLELEVAATTGELTQTNHRLVQKVRELKTIYDLALATAASTNVQEIIRVIIGGVKELVDVSAAAFFLYDKNTGLLEPLIPAFDRPPEETRKLACRLEDSKFLERIIQEGQPQILNFVEPDEQLPASWNDVAIRSILALPLRQDKQIAGLFCVVNKTNGLFSDDDIRLLSLLTNRVTEVLHRLALDQQLRQRVQDLGVLQEIAAHLPSPPILGDTVSAIARIIRQALPGTDVCLFFLHHTESEALAVMGGDWDTKLSFDPRALTIGISEKIPLADVFRDSQVAYFGTGASASGWEKDELLQTLALKEVLYLPLSVERRTIGVMVVGSVQKEGLTVEHRRLSTLIAEHVGVMIERSRLYERLRSANEKLEQINHLKNEFISMVSHELRTPLTTIKGFVSIVLNGETGALNDQQRYFLETSDRAIDRLTLLVSDLLDISRIEAGQIQMQLRPVSLKEVVARVGANFTPQFKAQSLDFTVQIPDKIPLVMGDPHRLTQILDNLVSNAIKFTSKGGITISAIDKGDFILVSVKDTGIGLAQTEQDRIFEKFYQVKVGGAWPAKGTGLGLAIVKSIVESHRGKIWVESELGKGADFRFILPRAREEQLNDFTGIPTRGHLL